MQNSENWVRYFSINLQQQRIDWTIAPDLTLTERQEILKSLQAWQLGETSEGVNLISAATKYTRKLNEVWHAHQKLFKAGGVNFKNYWKKMKLKFKNTIQRLSNNQQMRYTTI